MLPEAWLLRVAQSLADTDAAADAAADAATATGDVADTAADADDATDDAADFAADAADAADTAADAADAADIADFAATTEANSHWKGSEMRDGLLLIQVPGRYWGVTRVGWARRVKGDEWEFMGASVMRTGAVRTLADLAANGPGTDHVVSAPDKLPELLHRFTPRRVLVASEAAWSKYVQKPDGW